VASIWTGKSDAIQQWYETVCLSSVKAAVYYRLKGFRSLARNSELALLDSNRKASIQPAPEVHSPAAEPPKGTAKASAEPNPFPSDHRSHQLWERLPKGIREAVSLLSWAPGAAAGPSLSLEDCVQQLADELDGKGSAGNIPVHSMRRRQKTAADLNAVYNRCHGRDSLAAGRQEELLHDAREYAAMSLTAAVEELRLPSETTEADVEAACEKIRDRIVLDALTNYVPLHKYISDFHLGAREFKAALWTEGDPSLEDRARAAINKRVVFVGRLASSGSETGGEVTANPGAARLPGLSLKVSDPRPS
jgi:hypothetical protein